MRSKTSRFGNDLSDKINAYDLIYITHKNLYDENSKDIWSKPRFETILKMIGHTNMVKRINFKSFPQAVGLAMKLGLWDEESCEASFGSVVALVIGSQKFYDWFIKIHKNIINDKNYEIFIHDVDLFGKPCNIKTTYQNPICEAKIGFIKLSISIPSVSKIENIVILRGNSVGILLIIKNELNDDEFIVLTEQYRAPGAAKLLEIPAGMVDGIGNTKIVASKEIEEETGVLITEKDIVPLPSLGKNEFYTSQGLLDEKLSLYYVKKSIDLNELLDILKAKHGNEKEGESIKLKLVNLKNYKFLEFDKKTNKLVEKDDFVINDMKTAAAINMYLNLKKINDR